MLFRLRKSRH